MPAELIATLASGLRSDSRCVMSIAKSKVKPETLLIASAVDRLSLILWSKTKDGEKGINRPKSIVEEMSKSNKDPDNASFETADEFEKKRLEIIRKAEEKYGK